MLPQIHERVSDLPAVSVSDPETERYLFYSGVVALIASLTKQARVVIVLGAIAVPWSGAALRLARKRPDLALSPIVSAVRAVSISLFHAETLGRSVWAETLIFLLGLAALGLAAASWWTRRLFRAR